MGRRSRLRMQHAAGRITNTAVLDTVVGVHHTATVDKTWDAGANKKRLPDPLTVATAKKMFAWYDAAQVTAGELPKGACSFPHHEVDADGNVGAANLAACRNGLARLSGSNVPESEQDGVKRHLQAHLDDGKSSTQAIIPGRPSAKTTRSRAQLREGVTAWYRIENLIDTPGTAAIYIYDEIGYFGVSAQDFVAELAQLKVSTLEVHLNSPGGDVFDGLAIYNALRRFPAKKTGYIDGIAASAASFIAMACDELLIERNAQMMVHDASGICIGNASEMQMMATLLDKASDNIADIYLQRAGGTLEQWRGAMKVETWYSSAEAVTAGLADAVAGETDPPMPDSVPHNTWDLKIFAYAGRENAPAPVIRAEAAPEEPAAPSTDPAAVEPPAPQPVTDAPAPVEPAEAPVVEAEPEAVPVAVVDETPAAEPDDTVWAAMTRGLLHNATPSTVDELFAALQKEGIPA